MTRNAKLQFGHGSSAVETKSKVRSRLSRFRFNSATALQPWKHSWAESAAPQSTWLQFGHGSSAVETGTPRARTNSTFSRFNSATALQPWKPQLRPCSLGRSWRFNSATALQPWKPQPIYCHGAHASASIRPRLFSRGNEPTREPQSGKDACFNSATALQPWKLLAQEGATADQWAASIRPRLFSRGNWERDRSNAAYVAELQFGHGSSAVETWYSMNGP